jgi:hypothetical protein
MTFKQYFLLRESPDRAFFNIRGNTSHFTAHDDNPISLIVTKTGVISAPSNSFFHEDMLWRIYYLSKLEKKPLTTKMNDSHDALEVFGTITDIDISKMEVGKESREDLLRSTNSISLARMWKIPTSDEYGISFWKLDKVPKENRKTLGRYLTNLGISLDNVFVERSTKTGSHTETFDDFVNVSHKSTKDDGQNLKTVHLLSPQKKKQALLSMGVVPKTPLNINDRMNMTIGD